MYMDFSNPYAIPFTHTKPKNFERKIEMKNIRTPIGPPTPKNFQPILSSSERPQSREAQYFHQPINTNKNNFVVPEPEYDATIAGTHMHPPIPTTSTNRPTPRAENFENFHRPQASRHRSASRHVYDSSAALKAPQVPPINMPPIQINNDNSALERIASLMYETQKAQLQHQNQQQQQQSQLVSQLAKINVSNQINGIRHLNGNENKQKANDFFNKLEMATDGLTDSERIEHLGNKCSDRAATIFSDGKKLHRSYFQLKNYMINRLVMTDIRATTAFNILTTDIQMKPEEGIEAFGFRIGDYVNDGLLDLPDPDGMAIKYFLKNLQYHPILRSSARTIAATVTPGTPLDEIIRRIISANPNFKTQNEFEKSKSSDSSNNSGRRNFGNFSNNDNRRDNRRNDQNHRNDRRNNNNESYSSGNKHQQNSDNRQRNNSNSNHQNRGNNNNYHRNNSNYNQNHFPRRNDNNENNNNQRQRNPATGSNAIETSQPTQLNNTVNTVQQINQRRQIEDLSSASDENDQETFFVSGVGMYDNTPD